MAQNVFINVTVDPAIAKKVDRANHQHTVTGGASASGDASFSFDSTKVTTQTVAASIMDAVRQALASRGFTV